MSDCLPMFEVFIETLWDCDVEQVKSCKFEIAKVKINGCISEAYAYSLRKQLQFFNNTTDFLANIINN